MKNSIYVLTPARNIRPRSNKSPIRIAAVIGFFGFIVASPLAAVAGGGAELNAAGDRAFNTDDYVTSAKYYKLAVEAGSVEAEYSLAKQYQMGAGVQHNADVAIRLFVGAANAGVTRAMARAAYMYLDGDGIPQNLGLARKWAEAAAQRGDGGGSGLLGTMFDDGKGEPQDKCAALHWYRKADERGVTAFDIPEGDIYAAGQCGATDWSTARRLFEGPASKGNRLAIVRLHLLDRFERENLARAYGAALMAGAKNFVETLGSSAGDSSAHDSTQFNIWVEKNRVAGLNDNGTPR